MPFEVYQPGGCTASCQPGAVRSSWQERRGVGHHGAGCHTDTSSPADELSSSTRAPNSRVRLALLLALLLLLLPNASRAAPSEDQQWSRLQGLMAGVTVMHAVQPIGALVGEWPWKNKYFVSTAGAVLYGVTLGGTLMEQRWALYVAVIGPATGLATITTLAILDALDVTNTGVRPDVMQVAGGVLQVLAAIIAIDILIRLPDTAVDTGSTRSRVVPLIDARI